MSSGKGKTTCKEVNSTCKCTIIEKPMKSKSKREDPCKEKKQDCVATIVGVLSLPENFCQNNKKDECETKKDECEEDPCEEKKDECEEKKDDCVEVYRDLGECLQKCIIKTSKSKSDC